MPFFCKILPNFSWGYGIDTLRHFSWKFLVAGSDAKGRVPKSRLPERRRRHFLQSQRAEVRPSPLNQEVSGSNPGTVGRILGRTHYNAAICNLICIVSVLDLSEIKSIHTYMYLVVGTGCIASQFLRSSKLCVTFWMVLICCVWTEVCCIDEFVKNSPKM
jgi:hypothetical protein